MADHKYTVETADPEGYWLCSDGVTDPTLWVWMESPSPVNEITTLRTRLKSARDAAIAYRELTVCFKLNKAPSEDLFKRLDRANKWLAEDGEE